jgi:hypothetical protein
VAAACFFANIKAPVVDKGKSQSAVRVLDNVATLDCLIQTRLNTEAGNLKSKRGIIFNHGMLIDTDGGETCKAG